MRVKKTIENAHRWYGYAQEIIAVALVDMQKNRRYQMQGELTLLKQYMSTFDNVSSKLNAFNASLKHLDMVHLIESHDITGLTQYITNAHDGDMPEAVPAFIKYHKKILQLLSIMSDEPRDKCWSILLAMGRLSIEHQEVIL